MSTTEKRFFARGCIYNLAQTLVKFTSKTMPPGILQSLLENLDLDEKIYSSYGVEIVRVKDVDTSPWGVFVKIDHAGNVQPYHGRRGDPLENAPGADRLFFIDADGSVRLVRDGSIKFDMLLIPAPDALLREGNNYTKKPPGSAASKTAGCNHSPDSYVCENCGQNCTGDVNEIWSDPTCHDPHCPLHRKAGVFFRIGT